ncbi:MAG: bifunctional folylpolyglutamate synthase/dihydrofolate synthase [Pirellula sp.]|nr:bifunctional folylpolyglutamate synthase/dihydrofolate synthase [Pirellula sp.]
MDRSDRIYADAVRFLLDRVNYEKTTNQPYNQRTYRLARMERLLDLLGNPQNSAPIVHVAGSKGKGSTSWLIAESARAAGYQVGLYTSPHLVHLEERFVVNGTTISPKALCNAVEAVRAAANPENFVDSESPTFFELTTAMAWLIFREAKTDLNVIEVGLGGRLDSTNVCKSLISVITSISFDHQAQLGRTISEIATEKAGIIKPNQHTIAGARHPDARQVIRSTSLERQSHLWELGRDFDCVSIPPSDSPTPNHSYESPSWGMEFLSLFNTEGIVPMSNIPIGMPGRHQSDNGAIAIATCQKLNELGWSIPETAIREALRKTQVPCRIQKVRSSPNLILDTAHNVASISSLTSTLQETYGSRRKCYVFSCSKDKEYEAMLELLMGSGDQIVLTQYTTNPRFVPLELLESVSQSMKHRFPNVDVFSASSPDEALNYAVKTSNPNDLIICTGSFFLAAEYYANLPKLVD